MTIVLCSIFAVLLYYHLYKLYFVLSVYKYTEAGYAFKLIKYLLKCLISCRFSSTKLFYRMTGQVLVESMDLSAHRLSVKTSVEDESERADSTLSR